MRHVADRVKETSTTIGDSTIYLDGPMQGYQEFSKVLAEGAETYYCVVSGNGDWEVGVGTFLPGGGVTGRLTRDSILSSSNIQGGVPQLIEMFGTSEVFITIPAAEFDVKYDSHFLLMGA